MAQETRWKRDGWEASVRIGVLTPHADVNPESELQAMAPPGVAIHATRVPFGAMAAEGVMDPTIPLAPVRAFAEPPHLDNAAELLAAAPLKANRIRLHELGLRDRNGRRGRDDRPARTAHSGDPGSGNVQGSGGGVACSRCEAHRARRPPLV